MVGPGRDLLKSKIEVDEAYAGGEGEGLRDRLNLKKVLKHLDYYLDVRASCI
jgi:hypothetical protein